MVQEDWQTKAQEKRDSVIALIPQEWRISHIPSAEEQRDITGKYIQQFLNEREIQITETDAEGIVAKTTTGQWNAVDVTKAFCHRAALAHQMVNCLHEIFFEAAISDAEKLDAYYAEHKKPIGPLHGLPVSLKDQFHIKGVDTTMGYVGWIGTFQGHANSPKYRTYESEIVRELRNLGAVLYVKTAVPHTLMCGETVNNIIGYTWNPKNRFLSSGGSSGGEGALIGLKGSVLGFGTDIGGSIRIPAAFNGLFGIRPSSGRLPYEGMANSMDGQNSVVSVVGPLSSSVGGLRLAIKGLLSQEPWLHDPLVNYMPWRSEQEELVKSIVNATDGKGKLVFATFKHDGACAITPPVSRAIDLVVQAMEHLGHEIIEWKPSPGFHDRFNEVMWKTWIYDGGLDLHKAFSLSNEPLSPQLESWYGPIMKELPHNAKQFTASEIAATNIERREVCKEYMEYWNSTSSQTRSGRPVDAIISAVAPFPAARPNKYAYVGYSRWVNMVDYTAVVVPVTTADKNIDKRDEGFVPSNDVDREVYESYDPEIYDGAHVSVQLIGRRLQEEKMLAIAEYVANALKAAERK